jgi:hypothetical protein
MKNIHLIPTDKPSELYAKNAKLKLYSSTMAMDWYISEGYKPHHIYITSDEEIKEGDWCLELQTGKIFRAGLSVGTDYEDLFKKIVITTDQDLIKDGVQAIDDEFLEWFIKNPTCEFIKVTKVDYLTNRQYRIYNLPQEEPRLINNCPKCGLDLVEREGSKPVCTRIDCGGIIISNETLREWALKEEPKHSEYMEQKFIITLDQDTVQEYLNEGWRIISITPQHVAAGGRSMVGRFAIVLERM